MVAPTKFKQLQVGDKLNSGIGDLEAFGHVILSQSKLISFSDAGSAVNVCVLPAKSQILEIYVDVYTAFNSSGTDLLDIGVSGTANLFADNLDLSSAARLRGSSDVSQLANYDDIGDAQITVQALYTQSVADAAAGSARITVVYAAGNDLS